MIDFEARVALAKAFHLCPGCGAKLPHMTPEQEAGALHEMRVNDGEVPEDQRVCVCTECYAALLAKNLPGVKPRTK